MDTERDENLIPGTEEPKQEEPRYIMGFVTNCKKLYVRKRPEPTAKPVGVIDADTTVEIDCNRSTDDFYRVTTENGLYGYCVRQYIETLEEE